MKKIFILIFVIIFFPIIIEAQEVTYTTTYDETKYAYGDEITNKVESHDCESLLGPTELGPTDKKSPAWYLSLIFSIIRYVAIIILIIITVMDFVEAVASQDNDILKKAVNKVMKRAILCVVIFLLPTLIDFILQFIHESSIKDCINVNA